MRYTLHIILQYYPARFRPDKIKIVCDKKTAWGTQEAVVFPLSREKTVSLLSSGFEDLWYSDKRVTNQRYHSTPVYLPVDRIGCQQIDIQRISSFHRLPWIGDDSEIILICLRSLVLPSRAIMSILTDIGVNLSLKEHVLEQMKMTTFSEEESRGRNLNCFGH